jgi:hypothetical protein
MFGTIRKHQSWLWIIIITVIIISFVIFFSPNAGLTGGRATRGEFGSIDGDPITREQFLEGYRESQLRFLLGYGHMPRPEDANRMGFDLEREARTRLFLLKLIKDNQIKVSDEAAAQWLANALSDRRQRVFRMDSYEAFVKRLLQPNGFSERDLENYARHEVGVQQLVAVYGLGGKLVPPHEGERLYRQEHEQLVTSILTFSASNYLARVTVNPTNLSQFYSNRLASYQLPERVQVSYVKFDVTNYFAEAEQKMAQETNLTQRIDAIYEAQGPNFFTDTNGVTLGAEAAKAKIREQIRLETAVPLVRRKAAEFTTALADLPAPPKAEYLDQVATQQKLTVGMTAPFSDMEPPEELRVPPTFTRMAFALNEDEPFSSPIAAEDGFYVIALKKRLPKEMPSLESIREKVTEDYRMQQGAAMAREAGAAFQRQLTNGLAQGKAFEAICAEAKLTPITLPAFSFSTTALPELQGKADFSLVKNLASDLDPGKASLFMSSRDGGFIVFLKSRTPVDDAKLKAELPEYLANLRQERLYESFNEWINRQVTLARLTGPPQAAPATGAPKIPATQP